MQTGDMQETRSDKHTSLSGNAIKCRTAIRHLSGLAPGIIKISLYLGLTYIALFTGAATCHGQGCSYYLFRGHCSGDAWCNAQYIDEYSGSSTCADKPYSDVQNYCWGLTPHCSAAGTACTCVPSVTDTVTVSGSVACAVTGVGGWCSGSASVNISATDSLGHAITISPCGSNPCSVPLSEGSGTFDYSATCSGGQTATGSVPWALDLTPPTVSPSLSGGSLGLGGYYTSGPVTLTCTGSDALSGLQGITYGAQTASGEGAHTLSCTATDNGGNTTPYSTVVAIDSTPPTVALQCNGAACGGSWYHIPVSISVSAADATSGVAAALVSDDNGSTWVSSLNLTADGIYNILGGAVDTAGNPSMTSATIYIDRTAPVTAWTSPGGSWIHGTVPFSGTSTDAGSGVATVYISTDGGSTWTAIGSSSSWSYSLDTTTLTDGPFAIIARADDVAGNAGTSATLNFSVDNTVPTLTVPNPLMGTDPSQTTFISFDAGSGLANGRVTISGSGMVAPRVIDYPALSGTESIDWWDDRDGGGNVVTPGTYNVLIEIWDAAGNYTSATAQWIIITPPADTNTPIPWPTKTRTPTPTRTNTQTVTETPTSVSTACTGVGCKTGTATPTNIGGGGTNGGVGSTGGSSGSSAGSGSTSSSLTGTVPSNGGGSVPSGTSNGMSNGAATAALLAAAAAAAAAGKKALDDTAIGGKKDLASPTPILPDNGGTGAGNEGRGSQPKGSGGGGGQPTGGSSGGTQPKGDKVVDNALMDVVAGAQGARDTLAVRKLQFNKLDSGNVSVTVNTPEGTRLGYKATVAEEEGYGFTGTYYTPETITENTAGGLLVNALDKGAWEAAGLGSLLVNLYEFGKGSTSLQDFANRTGLNSKFWVSTGVDTVIAVVEGGIAALAVGGALALAAATVGFTAPLWVAVGLTAAAGIGIGALVDYLAPNFSSNIKTSINDSIDKLRAGLSAWGGVIVNGSKIAQALPGYLNYQAGQVAQSIQTNVITPINNNIVKPVVQAVSNTVQAVSSTVKSVATAVTSTVKSVASAVTSTVQNVASTVTSTVKTVTSTVASAVKTAVTTVAAPVIKAVTTIAAPVVQVVSNMATPVIHAFTAVADPVVKAITTVAAPVVKAVTSTVSTVVKTVSNAVDTVKNTVSKIFKLPW